jgi:hypothetical protein
MHYKRATLFLFYKKIMILNFLISHVTEFFYLCSVFRSLASFSHIVLCKLSEWTGFDEKTACANGFSCYIMKMLCEVSILCGCNLQCWFLCIFYFNKLIMTWRFPRLEFHLYPHEHINYDLSKSYKKNTSRFRKKLENYYWLFKFHTLCKYK